MGEVNSIPRLGGSSSALAKVGQGAQTRTQTRQPAGSARPLSNISGQPGQAGATGVVLPSVFQGGGQGGPIRPGDIDPLTGAVLGFPTKPAGIPGAPPPLPPGLQAIQAGGQELFVRPQGPPVTDEIMAFLSSMGLLGNASGAGVNASIPGGVTVPSVQTGLSNEQFPLPPGLQAFTNAAGEQSFVLPEGTAPTTEILGLLQALGQSPTSTPPPGAVPATPPGSFAPPTATGDPLPLPPPLPATSGGSQAPPADPVDGTGVDPAGFFAEFPGALPGRNFVNEVAPFILGAAQGETPEAFQQGVDVLTQLTGAGAAPAVESALQALSSGLSETPQAGFDRSGVEQAQEVFRAIASGGTTQSEAFQNAVIQPVLAALADAGVSRSGVVGSQVAEATIPFLLNAAQNLAQTSLGQQAQSGTLATQLGGLGLSQLAQRGDLATSLANLGGAQQGQQLGAAQAGAQLGLQGLTTEEGIANNLLSQLAAFGGLQQSLEQAGLDQQTQLAQTLLLGPTAQTLLPGSIGQSGQVPSSFSFGIPGLFSSQK